MSSSFGLLALGSRDLSQVEKERKACKAEQNQIFSLNTTPRTILSENSESAEISKQLFISQFDKNHVVQEPTTKI